MQEVRDLFNFENLKAVIFDLDGTLLDTLGGIASSMNRVLRSHSFPTHELGNYEYLAGDGLHKLVERALPEEVGTGPNIEDYIAEFRRDYLANWRKETDLFPGMDALLDALVARGVKLSVLSNKPEELTRICVGEYFSKWHFEAVLGDDGKRAKKPNPEGVLEISQSLGIPLSDFIFVGDTSIDMNTASAGGVFAVGVSWGFRKTEELKDSGADLIVDSPEELVGRIGSNLKKPRDAELGQIQETGVI